MHWTKIVAVAALVLLLMGGFAEPVAAFDEVRDSPTRRPVPGPVVRDFDPPAADWLPGHRGVDLAGVADQQVVAAAGGQVIFAGQLAGRPVISVELPSGARTTYEPVVASVSVGDQLTAGQVIGVLADGHCTPDVAPACLHFGVKRGDEYVDPNLLLARAVVDSPRIRLLPATAVDQVRERTAARRAVLGSAPAVPGGQSMRPADGPITSRYGIRRHPITGVVKLHDGLDIGAACGSPIRAARPGIVVGTQLHPAYGWWLIVEHRDGLRTGYAHAQRWIVGVGDAVAGGQQVGEVGSTGYSTGCHLHFMAWSHGHIIDPHALLDG